MHIFTVYLFYDSVDFSKGYQRPWKTTAQMKSAACVGVDLAFSSPHHKNRQIFGIQILLDNDVLLFAACFSKSGSSAAYYAVVVSKWAICEDFIVIF